MRFFFTYLLFSVGLLQSVIAQDSLTTPSKSTDSILKPSPKKKSFLRRKIDQFLIKPTTASHSTSKKIEKELNRHFDFFQDKIIRKIHIITYEPLGYDEKDSLKTPNKWENLGNLFHNKTKTNIVKRLLLFKEKSLLDSTIVKETERVLRSQAFIRRAYIVPSATQSKDSVDVTISVLDSWSLYADASGSLKEGTLRLFERNFLGYGHQISGRYSQEISGETRPGFGIEYRIPNIYATTINTMAGFSVDFNKYQYKYWSLWRPFYSIYSRWSGGVSLYQRSYEEKILLNDSIYRQNMDIHGKDLWGSISFPISKKKENSVTNLVFSSRFYQTLFKEKPPKELDEEQYFSNRNTYISSFGISKIGYEQDKYVFRNQDIEDIPIGKTFSLLSGIRENLGTFTPYAGFQAIYANYWKIGYVGAEINLGSFFNKNKVEQTTLKGELIYFSHLFSVGTWNFRQFAKWKYVEGIARKNYIKDRINLNGETGIIGFNSPILSGTRKSVLTLQTQSYSPKEWFGFRVNPFFVIDIGAIGEHGTSFLKDRFFTKWGIGFFITNDYVPLGNFQFSFVFFPRIPGVGSDIKEFSGRSNDDFKLPNLNHRIPEIIRYE